MAKELMTRIQLKYDTYENWNSSDLVLLSGEIAICTLESANAASNVAPTVLFKVGDGSHSFKDLKWASAQAADVYSWAKAEKVELDGKTLKFVKGEGESRVVVSEVPFNFATPEEVAAAVKVVADDVDALEAKVTALEGKFGTDGEIEGIKDRLDAIEGEEGLIATGDAATLEAAKGYADAQDVALKGVVEGLIATAKSEAIADAKTETEKQISDLNSTIVAKNTEFEGLISANTQAIAKEVEDRAAAVKEVSDKVDVAKVSEAIETAKQGAISASKDYVDGIVTAQKEKDDAQDAAIEANTGAIAVNAEAIEALQGAVATKVESEAFEAYKGDVTSNIATAKQEAINDAASKVSALENGQVKTNKEAIATNAAAIEEVRGLVTAEANRAKGVEEGLDSRLEAVEAFFVGAASDKELEGEIQNALDTLVEIQNYISNDGQAGKDLLDAVDANADAIEALSGRMDTAEDAIDAVEADVEALEGKVSALETLTGEEGAIRSEIADAAALGQKGIDDAKAASDKVDTKAAEIKTAYEAYADGKVSAAQTAVESALNTAVSGLQAKDEELAADIAENLAAIGVNVKAISDEVAAREAAVSAEAKAREDADKAINDKISELEGTVEAVSDVADQAAADVEAIKGRLDTAEGAIDALEAIVNGEDGNVALGLEIDAIAAIVNGADGNVALGGEIDALAQRVTTAEGTLATTTATANQNKTDIATVSADVEAIKGDYLRAADEFIINCGSASQVTFTK